MGFGCKDSDNEEETKEPTQVQKPVNPLGEDELLEPDAQNYSGNWMRKTAETHSVDNEGSYNIYELVSISKEVVASYNKGYFNEDNKFRPTTNTGEQGWSSHKYFVKSDTINIFENDIDQSSKYIIRNDSLIHINFQNRESKKYFKYHFVLEYF